MSEPQGDFHPQRKKLVSRHRPQHSQNPKQLNHNPPDDAWRRRVSNESWSFRESVCHLPFLGTDFTKLTKSSAAVFRASAADACSARRIVSERSRSADCFNS